MKEVYMIRKPWTINVFLCFFDFKHGFDWRNINNISYFANPLYFEKKNPAEIVAKNWNGKISKRKIKE